MKGRVAIVTDSAASLPAELAKQWDVTVVPLQLDVGGQVDDETRVEPETLLTALRNGVPVSTAPPEVGAFFWAYQQAAVDGAKAVISIHIAAGQSHTCAQAREAAAQTQIPVHVLDSRSVGMSLGFAVLAAARSAGAGGDVLRVISAARHRLERCVELLHVESLDHLRRGGRITLAQHVFGAMAGLKPMLAMEQGGFEVLGRHRGGDRAIRALVDEAVKRAGEDKVDLAVEYFGTDERAAAILARLRDRVPNIGEALLVETSAALAANVGPGGLGIALSPV
jgi:DegV family protein with EDD domain